MEREEGTGRGTPFFSDDALLAPRAVFSVFDLLRSVCLLLLQPSSLRPVVNEADGVVSDMLDVAREFVEAAPRIPPAFEVAERFCRTGRDFKSESVCRA